MTIRMAHLRDQGIDFAVFDADARTKSNADRARLLADLTSRARASGYKIDKSALAYTEYGRLTFYGAPDLVRYLAGRGVAGWTRSLTV